MIARLLVGGIVAYPVAYMRPPPSGWGLVGLIALALVVALCVPDHWLD